jgi:2',3'-cyclic-nucleotide 2'-phosphodiesterase (5'-nucleotidase family)
MGGLARRVSYIKAFKQRSNTEVPTLFVDAGNLFTDDRFSANELPTEVMTKNKWVVKGYGDFHHDAANISYIDLPYVGQLLKKDG